jgi:hypothetical protein
MMKFWEMFSTWENDIGNDIDNNYNISII